MIGNTVSHYRILERLGHGGMGVVYKAEDTRLRRFVAVKFLSDTLNNDKAALERLRREARAASALNHPNICAIHDIDEHEGRPFIVMELLEGETLNAKIRGRPLEAAQILNIARQIAAALDASHEKQIIHRDIKPSNVMVTPRGDVKVLDFGLAKTGGSSSSEASTAMTEVGSLLGTVQYMSPEQALGHAVDQRSDLFSLGVVLYEMATEQLPFTGSSPMETINHIINTEPEAIAAAASMCQESLDLFRELGQKNGIASALCILGDVARRQQNYAAAGSRYDESLALFREMGDKHGAATALNGLGEVARRLDDFVTAASLFRESLTIFRETGATADTLPLIENLAELALASGENERAVNLFGASQALRVSISVPRPPNECDEFDRIIGVARAALTEEGFAAAWSSGHTMTWDQTFTFALKQEDK